jgi:hypothetical protein
LKELGPKNLNQVYGRSSHSELRTTKGQLWLGINLVQKWVRGVE